MKKKILFIALFILPLLKFIMYNALNADSKEEKIIYESLFGFKIDLPKEYVAINQDNIDELKKLKNLDPGFLNRFKNGFTHKKQEIYLDKNHLTKNGFTDNILLGNENYNYENEFDSVYNNELEQACADFTDVYRKSFRTVEHCNYIKYNNKKAFNVMGKILPKNGVVYYQVFYLFNNKTMIFTLTCKNNCEKMATDLNEIIYSIEKNNPKNT